MADTPEMVEIARFPSRIEAESVGHALDQYGIPFVVRSDDVGIYGPGMTGWSPQGASLWVASRQADEVRELLSCVAGPVDDAELERAAEEDGEEPPDGGPDPAA